MKGTAPSPSGRTAIALPPRLIFAAALARAISIGIGFVLVAVGAALSAIVTWRFVRARTPISPLSPSTALVLDGPYRFTRNPDYIGQALLAFGLALLLDAPVAIVMTIAALRFLERRQYQRRVPRWL